MFICIGSCVISHVGLMYNERVDVLSKVATERHLVDMEVKVTRHLETSSYDVRNLPAGYTPWISGLLCK